MSASPILYPNITSLPGSAYGPGEGRNPSGERGIDSEFNRVLEKELDYVKAPLKFSAHATQRLKDRKISMDPGLLAKVSEAVDLADSKGIEDSLVITPQAALIINVRNRTVVTAMDRNSVFGNVFTNIDGAVIV